MGKLVASLALSAFVLASQAGPVSAAKPTEPKMVKVYVCHWDEEETAYVLIHPSARGADNHIMHHPKDFLAPLGKDTDCNTPHAAQTL